MDSTPLAWQLVLRLEDDRVLAPSRAARRKLARVMARLGDAFGVYVWCAADNHLHVGLFATLRQVREFARRLMITLANTFRHGSRFRRPRITPIHDQSHARNVLLYTLGQSAHHGAAQDPWHEANAIHDLVGSRVGAPWIVNRVREFLPRVTRADMLRAVGLPAFEEVAGLDADAAAAAFGLPDVAGKGRSALAARAAAVHAAPPDCPTSDIARELGISPRAVQRMRKVKVPPAHLRAIRRQLGLRAALAARALASDNSMLVAEAPPARYTVEWLQ